MISSHFVLSNFEWNIRISRILQPHKTQIMVIFVKNNILLSSIMCLKSSLCIYNVGGEPIIFQNIYSFFIKDFNLIGFRPRLAQLDYILEREDAI